MIVPSKFYGIAAAGGPTIFIGDPNGEIARLIAIHGCGCIVTVGDGAALAQTIRELAADPQRCRQMGERARLAFEAGFDTSIAIRRWEELMGEVGGTGARPLWQAAERSAVRGAASVFLQYRSRKQTVVVALICGAALVWIAWSCSAARYAGRG